MSNNRSLIIILVNKGFIKYKGFTPTILHKAIVKQPCFALGCSAEYTFFAGKVMSQTIIDKIDKKNYSPKHLSLLTCLFLRMVQTYWNFPLAFRTFSKLYWTKQWNVLSTVTSCQTKRFFIGKSDPSVFRNSDGVFQSVPRQRFFTLSNVYRCQKLTYPFGFDWNLQHTIIPCADVWQHKYVPKINKFHERLPHKTTCGDNWSAVIIGRLPIARNKVWR